MELTLDQALQKGVEAHRAGKAQEADRYYTIILKANPKHPDANHNIGALAVGVGKIQEALPFFKTALEANPNIAQFWLSYIDALIKLDQMADAKAVFDQAKGSGAKGDGFDQIEQRLGGLNANNDIKNLRIQNPSKDQMQPLVTLYTQGQYQEAFREASELLLEFPNSVTLYNIIGAANRSLGNLEDSIRAYNKALSINPDYAETYNNMGNALKEQGKLEEAIESYNKAILIKPDYADAYNNKGSALEAQDKLDGGLEAYNKAPSIKLDHAHAYNNIGNALKADRNIEKAIEAYNKALSIQPYHLEALLNKGNALLDQGKVVEAIEVYNKAIMIKPDYADAYNNLGAALQNIGKLEEAIEAYNNALSIKPAFSEVWSNIIFPLQATKMALSSRKKLTSYYPKNSNSKDAQVFKSLLQYKLSRGQNTEISSLNKALDLLANAKNIIIQNPTKSNKTSKTDPVVLKKMIALIHFGRSGTGLLHSLVDNHPQVSTLPSIYFSEYFDHSTWNKITADGWNNMVERFMAIYDVLFDATSSTPIETISKRLIKNIGQKEGMTKVGNQRNEVLSVDKKVFYEELSRLIGYHDQMDILTFFKLVHLAYNKATNDLKEKNLIFYHIHNPDTYAELNFACNAKETKWIMMVREPIQSLESWIKSKFQLNDHLSISIFIISMLFDLNKILHVKQEAIGVRLEDLKEKPRKTIPALCEWMGIEERNSLYEMTAQGKKWWGDPTSQDYSKDGMDPFGKTSINRKIGSIFSENDQFILRTLFYPFRVRFGYTKENTAEFEDDLQKIKPMLDSIFDFEKILVERTNDNNQKFMKSGSFLYLRAGLIDRWNTLNELGTYPNMLQRLPIN